MSKPVFIYGLCQPGTTIVRYIGKTKQSLKARLLDHMAPSKLAPKTHKNHWLRALRQEGLKPEIILLDIGDDETWEDLERFHIAAHRADGFPLTNGDDGGTGNHDQRVYPPAVRWALEYDACTQCGTTVIEHAAHGLCETCYCRSENRHLWKRQRTWDAHLWSVAYPDLEGCLECGSSDNPHAGNGLCSTCYAAQYRARLTSSPWKHRSFPCCQECGTTERSHCARGLCRPCYMKIWYQNVGHDLQQKRRGKT